MLISDLERQLQQTPIAELPIFIAQLEGLKAVAWHRLTANGNGHHPHPDHDELLTVAQAAERLRTSKDHVYRNASKFPFTVRDETLLGQRLRFSAQGIDRYIRQRAGH